MTDLGHAFGLLMKTIYVRRNAKSKPELTAAEAAAWWPKRQKGDV